MNAAKRVFLLKGYDLTSMEEIIEEVKMSKGGVYHYFSGKEEIFEAIVNERADHFSSFPFDKAPSVWGAIQLVLSGIAEEVKHSRESFAPVIFEYFMRSYRDTSREHLLREQYHRGVSIWVSAIEKGIASGEFTPKLPAQTIAQTVVSLVDGMYCDSLQLGHAPLNVDEQMTAVRFFLANVLSFEGD